MLAWESIDFSLHGLEFSFKRDYPPRRDGGGLSGWLEETHSQRQSLRQVERAAGGTWHPWPMLSRAWLKTQDSCEAWTLLLILKSKLSRDVCPGLWIDCPCWDTGPQGLCVDCMMPLSLSLDLGREEPWSRRNAHLQALPGPGLSPGADFPPRFYSRIRPMTAMPYCELQCPQCYEDNSAFTCTWAPHRGWQGLGF